MRVKVAVKLTILWHCSKSFVLLYGSLYKRCGRRPISSCGGFLSFDNFQLREAASYQPYSLELTSYMSAS